MGQDAPSVDAPLPVRLTSFVGRVRELQAVLEELGQHRLVSLVGPGGCGKTRLALEAGRAWTGGSRWFVDLATVGDDDEVDAALAVATGALEGPGERPLEATVRRIGDGRALILLDNCDQVVAACARVVHRLLQSCPGLTVLATSREPLRAEGESVWRVPGLSLPGDEEAVDGDAVLLFLDRASLAGDDAVADHAIIHEICRRLDGMPLAIELAASRATVLPVADILDGLSDRFRLLTGGLRTADPRHQSLAASLEWSYRLLEDDERRVLARLAVFRRPFTAEGARAVAAGDGIDERDVLGLLANLVDKSFVVIDERHEVARYRLLETIREYAHSQLETQPDDARAARDCHLRYVRHAAERFGAMLEGVGSTGHSLEHFQPELPDVRAAVAWAAETAKADDALRVVGALAWWWYLRARSEDRRVIDAALAIEGGPPRWRAMALSAAGLGANAAFDPQAVGFASEAVRFAKESGDTATMARALTRLGRTYVYFDLSQARPHLLEACALAREADDQRCLADALTALVYTEFTDLRAARVRAEEALAIAIATDNEFAASDAHVSLATIGMLQGRLDEAVAAGAAVLGVIERYGDRLRTLLVRVVLAWVAVLRADEGAALEHAGAAQAIATASGNPLLTDEAALATGAHSYLCGDLDRARADLARALPLMSVFVGGVTAPEVAAVLADAGLLAGDVAGAREHVAHAVTLAEAAGTDWGRSRAAVAQSRLHLHDGEIQAAGETAHRALELAQHTEDTRTTIDALELLAELAQCRRSPELATRLLAAASGARTRTGYARHRLHTTAHAALVADLGQELNEAFATVWSEGEKLSLPDAVALARRGRGRRRRPATGWEALTPAERRVVALVGDGLNNVQIAERLFVTRETVKSHVSHAFTKLGVSNRAELAAEAARRGQHPTNRASTE